MMEETVRQIVLEPACGANRNAHLSVPKKNGKYCCIITAMSTNGHIRADAGIPSNVEEFYEAFARLPIAPLTNFHSGYNQKMLHEDSWEYTACQSTHGMNRPTKQAQEATDSESGCVRVS
jgi:hypothetical protein